MSENHNQSQATGQSFGFDGGIARHIGVTAAVLYSHIIYWLRYNYCHDQNIIAEKVWTYDTIDDISSYLGFFSEKQVREALQILVETGYLIKDNHNKNKFDKTTWYSVPDQSIIQKELSKVTKSKSRGLQKVTIQSDEKSPSSYIHNNTRETPTSNVADFSLSSNKEESIKIYDCLMDLNIPLQDKIEITSKSSNTEDRVIHAVKYATHPLIKIKTTLQQAIKWALNEQILPSLPKLPEDVLIENRRIASDFKAKAIIPSTMYFEEFLDRVEIGYNTAQKEPFELKFSENGFKEQLANFLNKNGVKCRK